MYLTRARELDTWQVLAERHINHSRAFLRLLCMYSSVMWCKCARTWNKLIRHNDTWISIIIQRTRCECKSQMNWRALNVHCAHTRREYRESESAAKFSFMLRHTRNSNMTACLILLFFLILNSGESMAVIHFTLGSGRDTRGCLFEFTISLKILKLGFEVLVVNFFLIVLW